MTNAELGRLKGRLTKLVKAGNPEAIVAECDRVLGKFEGSGWWPDCWSDWQRAKDDAARRLR